MGTVKPPQKAILFTGILYCKTAEPEYIYKLLEKEFGAIILTSRLFTFIETEYYKEEMGKNLTRVFAAFDNLIEKDCIVDIKLKTNQIEDNLFSVNGKRSVNIDPGYLTSAKVVLATTKNFQHRLYLKKGIFAEVTLRYRKDSYSPWEWTFRDYKREESIDFFNKLRVIYRMEIKNI